MRGRRSAYLVIFAVAALGAGALVAFSQPRTEIVRTRVDIAVLTPIGAEMLEVVRVAPADAPPNAARSLGAVVGRFATVGLLSGQDVDLRALETTPGERTFGFGAPLGPGQLAFALPVDPAAAVGGALAPGARVDVIAVPNSLKSGGLGGSGTDAPTATILGQGLVVLALRTTDGSPLTDAADSAGTRVVVVPKLGSVVVAVPAAGVADFATASVTSTFVLALVPDSVPPAAAP